MMTLFDTDIFDDDEEFHFLQLEQRRKLITTVTIFTMRTIDIHGKYLNMERFSEEKFKALFRFEKNDFLELLGIMKFPNKVKFDNGSILYGEEILMILLRRLAYPSRLEDLEL